MIEQKKPTHKLVWQSARTGEVYEILLVNPDPAVERHADHVLIDLATGQTVSGKGESLRLHVAAVVQGQKPKKSKPKKAEPQKQHHPAFGKLITGAEERDAVHVAVAPVVATCAMTPGQHIGFLTPGDTTHVTLGAKQLIGIVDPFLPHSIHTGDRFWMFLYPQTITSLRHDWDHPAFAPPEIPPSEKWLRDYAEKVADLPYESLMEGAQDYLNNRVSMIEGGKYEGIEFPDEFWDHYHAVTGQSPTGEFGRWAPFSCAC